MGKNNFDLAHLLSACLIGMLLLVVVPGCFAQLPTATIAGVVTDATGAVVPSATLTARNIDTGQTRNAVTSDQGSYRFDALPVGNYEVKAEHQGFKASVRSGLTLTVTQEATVNFTFEVGSTEQTVSVTGEAPLVNTTTSSLGGLVDEARVADLPLNGRNFIDLTFLQTGVIQNKNLAASGSAILGQWYSSNGAPLRSNNFLLDGALMQDANGGGPASVAGTTTGIEGIREYRVITNSFSAEYGLTMGSQTVMVSKSGTDTFHGSAFEYIRNSALDARNYFDTPQGSNGHRLPEFRRNNFGGAIGGPIKKDKLFFFTALELLRQTLGITTVGTGIAAGCRGPTGAPIWNGVGVQPAGSLGPCSQLGGTTSSTVKIAPLTPPLLALFPVPNLSANQYTYPFTQPVHDNWGMMRMDYNISSSDSFFGRYTIDDSQEVFPLANQNFVSNLTSRSQYLTLSENHIFTPTVLNTLRGSFSRTNPVSLPGFTQNLIGPQYSFVPGYPVGTITPGSGITASGPSFVTIYDQNLYTVSDDLFYTKGRHSLKFGTLINFYRYDTANESNQVGALTFPNLGAFLTATPSVISAEVPGLTQERLYHYRTYGFYAQDDFRMTRNFTLNLGLRYEFFRVPYDVYGRNNALRDIVNDSQMTPGPVIENSSLRNFSPRVGFAWDVRGNGRTALRGGFAELYDIGDLGSALNHDVTAKVPYSLQATVNNPGVLTSLPLVFPASSIGKTLRQLDYKFRQPRLLSYNLAVEQQLPFNMSVTLAYAGSRGINLVQIIEGNPVIPRGVPVNAGTPQESCAAPAAGQVVNTSSVLDGIATACYLGTELRRNPNWGPMNMEGTGSESWYNSLQVGVMKRLTKGLQFQSSFTWSRLIDIQGQGQYNSEDGATENNFSPDPLHLLQVSKGPAAFNVPLNWRLNAIYNLPNFVAADRPLAKLTNGWWTSGIVSLQSGYFFTPSIQNQRSRSQVQAAAANIDRPNVVTNANLAQAKIGDPLAQIYDPNTVIVGTPANWFNPHMFTLPPLGFIGNAGRNNLRGPAFATLDMSIVKDTALHLLGEAGKVEFRAEAFNILNHANFAIPSARTVFSGALANTTEAPLSNAGQITKTVGTSRQIQFGLKLLF